MTMRGPISEDTLAKALAGGVLTANQVEALHALEQEGAPPGSTGPADSEHAKGHGAGKGNAGFAADRYAFLGA